MDLTDRSSLIEFVQNDHWRCEACNELVLGHEMHAHGAKTWAEAGYDLERDGVDLTAGYGT